MLKDPQHASPVISPRVSTVAGLFSQVREAVDDRLKHTVVNPNSLQNTIASGRASAPVATVANEPVAEVLDFTPLPGRQPGRRMRLDVFEAPASRVDTVIDAIQRYLNIEPRREPTADPKNEASIARHPQQIIQAAQYWDDALPYQYAQNGVRTQHLQPEFRAWGASLTAQAEEAGTTGISAPPTRSPLPGRLPLGRYMPYDPARAAQEAMADLTGRLEPAEVDFVQAGPPLMTEDPYFDPAYAAQNAMGRLRSFQATADAPRIRSGAPGYIDDPYNDPAFAAANAVARTRANLEMSAGLDRYTRPEAVGASFDGRV
ncbi:MAG: hypothetical protein LBS31_11250 [Candidatus Adiutrix sp.]|nr:hypothetical protein [Candidatus Adiutrix sp.]